MPVKYNTKYNTALRNKMQPQLSRINLTNNVRTNCRRHIHIPVIQFNILLLRSELSFRVQVPDIRPMSEFVANWPLPQEQFYLEK